MLEDVRIYSTPKTKSIPAFPDITCCFGITAEESGYAPKDERFTNSCSTTRKKFSDAGLNLDRR